MTGVEDLQDLEKGLRILSIGFAASSLLTPWIVEFTSSKKVYYAVQFYFVFGKYLMPLSPQFPIELFGNTQWEVENPTLLILFTIAGMAIAWKGFTKRGGLLAIACLLVLPLSAFTAILYPGPKDVIAVCSYPNGYITEVSHMIALIP
ncbi:MAG: hypothetical protein ACE5Z5_07670 [Candidatus Bathyarchaeia archaeon]